MIRLVFDLNLCYYVGNRDNVAHIINSFHFHVFVQFSVNRFVNLLDIDLFSDELGYFLSPFVIVSVTMHLIVSSCSVDKFSNCWTFYELGHFLS